MILVQFLKDVSVTVLDKDNHVDVKHYKASTAVEGVLTSLSNETHQLEYSNGSITFLHKGDAKELRVGKDCSESTEK